MHPGWTDDERTVIEAYQGRAESPEELFALVYNELRQVAHAYMRRERPDHTLQTTALVHEAYLRLVGTGAAHCWDNRRHFYAAAAEAIKQTGQAVV